MRLLFLEWDIDKPLRRMALEEDKNLTETVNDILRKWLRDYLRKLQVQVGHPHGKNLLIYRNGVNGIEERLKQFLRSAVAQLLARASV